MVIIHVKHKDESQFLYQTPLTTSVDDLVQKVTAIYNGRLKVHRVCMEIEELAKHGTLLPPGNNFYFSISIFHFPQSYTRNYGPNGRTSGGTETKRRLG